MKREGYHVSRWKERELEHPSYVPGGKPEGQWSWGGREVKGAERGRGLGDARRVLTKNGESSGAGKMSLQQKYGPKGGMK